jgi:hypothetical protein
MRTTQGVAAGLLAAVLAVPGTAQQAAPEVGAPAQASEGQAFEEVIVRGRRMSEVEDELRVEIGKFIGEVTVTFGGRGFARWDRSVCVGVHNLEATAAQYIVDRISRLAHDVGLTPGGPGCAPSAIIIFTTDGKELASNLVATESGLLRPTNYLGTHRGLAALDRFVATDKAVRWWQTSLPVDARTGAPAIERPETRLCGAPFCPPKVNVAGPSRIHSGVRDALQYVIIIVDSTKLTGTTWQQLGDYLAVVSLAQIDLEADPSSFDSILNLFTNPKAYSGLTDWDRTYMQALYSFDQERNPVMQAGALGSEMLRIELDIPNE